jgi:hypothetical protein
MHDCEKKGLTKRAFRKRLKTKGAFVVWFEDPQKRKAADEGCILTIHSISLSALHSVEFDA